MAGLGGEDEAREPDCESPDLGRPHEESLVRAERGSAPPTRRPAVLRGVFPCALVAGHQDRFGGEDLEEASPTGGLSVRTVVAGEGRREQPDRGQVARRALIGDLEGADRRNPVAEELDPDRIGQAQGEDVDESAPECVLADLLDERRPLVAHRLEPLHERRQTDLPAGLDVQVKIGQPVGDGHPLPERARGRHEDAPALPQERLDRFDPECIDSGVAVLPGPGTALVLWKEMADAASEE